MSMFCEKKSHSELGYDSNVAYPNIKSTDTFFPKVMCFILLAGNLEWREALVLKLKSEVTSF